MNSPLGAAIGYCPGPPKFADPKRWFSSANEEINVAREAITEATKSLEDLMGRLGIPQLYGESPLEQEICNGEMEATTRNLTDLVDAARKIRGMADTINSRL